MGGRKPAQARQNFPLFKTCPLLTFQRTTCPRWVQVQACRHSHDGIDGCSDHATTSGSAQGNRQGSSDGYGPTSEPKRKMPPSPLVHLSSLRCLPFLLLRPPPCHRVGLMPPVPNDGAQSEWHADLCLWSSCAATHVCRNCARLPNHAPQSSESRAVQPRCAATQLPQRPPGCDQRVRCTPPPSPPNSWSHSPLPPLRFPIHTSVRPSVRPCVRTCVRACTHTHTNTYVHLSVRPCARTHVRTYTHTYTHTHIHPSVRPSVRTYVRTCVYTHTHKHLRTSVRPSVRAHARTYVHTHTHIRPHTHPAPDAAPALPC